jgi:NTE family protein
MAATTLLCAWPIAAQESAQAPRPRVGLVLGGGGARGAAHVGVLKALEELHIPVDCVVGTSVGALVGGIYATGNTAAQVDERIRAIDWSETLAFTALREQSPMRRKQAGITYSNSIEFGITDKGVSSPPGVINTQHVEQTIRDLVRTSGVSDDFDKLAIPYRAVATDMQSGKMKVLERGDLAQAMRASMAVPGVFAPVIVDKRVLADGGMVRNLPVDVAKSSCADVVIAVWVSTPTPEAESLLSPLALISRSFDVVVDANVKTQLESLTPQDVPIEIDMKDISSSSFDRVADAIPLGYDAMMAKKTELQRFVVSAERYSAWRTKTSRERPGEAQLAGINVNGLKRVSADYVLSSLDIEPGQPVNEKILSEQMAAVFALGDFESVSYRLRGDPSRALLEIDAIEKSWGPRFLRADIGLTASSQGETPFVLRADYLQNWVNKAGGEVHGALQIGRTSLGELSLYQPVSTSHSWFVEPGVVLRSSLEDVYADGDTVARFDLRHVYATAEVGRTFARLAEMRVGLRGGKARARPDIATPAISGTDQENQVGWTADFVLDTRNKPLLPTHGWLTRIDYFSSEKSFNSENNYRRLDSLVQAAFGVRNDVIIAAVAGGTAFNSDLPIYETFVLGGPTSFPGFGIGELRGSDYWLGSVAYLRKVADISKIFGQALYAGLQLQAGAIKEVSQLNSSGFYDGTLYSGSVFLTARTPIGPATLSVAAASTNSWLVTISFGRPIEEGSILDFAR